MRWRTAKIAAFRALDRQKVFSRLWSPAFAGAPLRPVFALHTYSFILMMLCAVLAFFAVLTWLGFDPKNPVLDDVMSVGLPRTLYAFTLTVIAAALLLAYRFFLFVFTITTT